MWWTRKCASRYRLPLRVSTLTHIFLHLRWFPSVVDRNPLCLSLSSWAPFSIAQPCWHKGTVNLGNQKVTPSWSPSLEWRETRLGITILKNSGPHPGFSAIITGGGWNQGSWAESILRAAPGLILVSGKPDRAPQATRLFSVKPARLSVCFLRQPCFVGSFRWNGATRLRDKKSEEENTKQEAWSNILSQITISHSLSQRIGMEHCLYDRDGVWFFHST